MTTSLIWFVEQLLQPIKDYRDDTKKYDKYLKAEPLFFGASSAKAEEVATPTPAVKPAATTTDAAAPAQESESWGLYFARLAVSPVTYMFSSSSDAPQQAAVETPITIRERATVALASAGGFGVDVDLKAKKHSEATAFVKAIEESLFCALASEKDVIRSRILDIKAIHATEIKRIDELLQEKDAKLGDYDALLKVFGVVLNEALKDEILTALTITLKMEDEPAHAVVERATGHGKKANRTTAATDARVQPIPELRELCSFLMQQIMQLRIDEARGDQVRLKHSRLLENPYSPKIVSENLDAIRALDSIHTKYGASENDVLMHTIAVLGKIVLKNKEISEALGSKNEFMLTSLAELDKKLKSAEEIQRKRENGKLLLAPSPTF